MQVSLGVMGSLPPESIRELALAAEDAGLHALWLNVQPTVDVLGKIAGAVEATGHLTLATGVIPLDGVPAQTVLARVAELGLPHDRLVLGVGSGGSARPLELVAQSLGEFEAHSDLAVVVGALGPKMRALAAQRAHGLLLSWLTPETAAQARDDAVRDATAAGRTVPRLVCYIRTTVDPAAHDVLVAEAARYESYPSYAANFRRIGHSALDATIQAHDARSLASAVARYDGIVDELVLRAITVDNSVDEIRTLIAAAAA